MHISNDFTATKTRPVLWDFRNFRTGAGLRSKKCGVGAGWDSMRGACGCGQDFTNSCGRGFKFCGFGAGGDKKFQPVQDSSGNGAKEEIRKLVKTCAPTCQWTYWNLPARRTDVIRWRWRPPASKMSNLRSSKQGQVVSMYRLFIPQRKPKLGRTKPSTWSHAARGLA